MSFFDGNSGGSAGSNNNITAFAENVRETQDLLLLFVSTTGDGEQTDTIRQTWKQLLSKSLPADLFAGIPVALFCLGDRAYGPQKFCAAGRKLLVRLRQLGCDTSRNCNPGYGDDGTPNGGVFADLDNWLQQELVPSLALLSGVPQAEAEAATTTEKVNPVFGNNLQQKAPYHVQRQQPSNEENGTQMNSNQSNNGNNNNMENNNEEEEWQLSGFTDFYNEFFNHCAPLSSEVYSYDDDDNDDNGLLVRRRKSSSSSATTDRRRRRTVLLLGRVVENRRLTALDWEQNTRNISLRIGMTTRSDPDDNRGPEEEDDGTPPTLLDDDNVSSTSTPPESSLPLPSDDGRLDNSLLLPFRAGDIASIMPSNPIREVNALIAVLPSSIRGIVHDVITISMKDTDTDDEATNSQFFPGIGYRFWPTRCTLRGWLTHCADIHALPEREDLRALAAFCSPSHERGQEQSDKLVSLSTTRGSALYADYILREKRSWADVLYDFDSLRHEGSLLTLECLLGLLGPIRPRDFSIASSPTKDFMDHRNGMEHHQGFGLELCVAVVEGTTRLGRHYTGLCSQYLASLEEGSFVRMWIRPGSFHGLPLETEKPVLCIGAGTGVAPLRGMLQERVAVRHRNTGQQNELNLESPTNTLLFGCRKESTDFYYKDEWNELQQSGDLDLLTAFSRDQWHKIYVQQVLAKANEERQLILRHVNANGSIYIAGGPKMARAVRDTIVEALAQQPGWDERKAQQILARMQRQGRFSVEAWS